MSGRRGLISGAAALLALAVVGWWAWGVMYTASRDRLLADLEAVRAENEQLEGWVLAGAGIGREIERLTAGAIGGEPDFAEHALRTALRELASRAGLAQVEITSGAPTDHPNPYARARRVPSRTLQRALKDRRDFATIDASVEGVGTLEQVLRLVAMAESQPWVHRITGLSISPEGKGRERFRVRAQTTSLYLPGAGEADVPEVRPADERAVASYRPIAMKNVFRLPPEPEPKAEPAAPEPEPEEPPAPAPPFGEWRMTGVWETSSGAKVIMANTQSGASRTLEAGDAILGATLVEATRTRAVFELDGKKYEVLNGETLAQRRALDQ